MENGVLTVKAGYDWNRDIRLQLVGETADGTKQTVNLHTEQGMKTHLTTDIIMDFPKVQKKAKLMDYSFIAMNGMNFSGSNVKKVTIHGNVYAKAENSFTPAVNITCTKNAEIIFTGNTITIDGDVYIGKGNTLSFSDTSGGSKTRKINSLPKVEFTRYSELNSFAAMVLLICGAMRPTNLMSDYFQKKKVRRTSMALPISVAIIGAVTAAGLIIFDIYPESAMSGEKLLGAPVFSVDAEGGEVVLDVSATAEEVNAANAADPSKTFYLKEGGAPTGYSLDEKVLRVVVTEDGNASEEAAYYIEVLGD